MQSPRHSTPRAASSCAYASVWPGPPNDANALTSVATLMASARAEASSSGDPVPLTMTSLTLASVGFVMRFEEVDVLLDGLRFGGERLIRAATAQGGFLQDVGLGLVQRDGDRVGGDARRRRAAVVALERSDAGWCVAQRNCDGAARGVAVGAPVDGRTVGIGEGDRAVPRRGRRARLRGGRVVVLAEADTDHDQRQHRHPGNEREISPQRGAARLG